MTPEDTHIKYDHFYYPKLLELKCPDCNKKCYAKNEAVPEEMEYFIDIAPYKRVWEFKCTNCIKTQSLDWKATKRFTLWNRLEIRNELLWAWNTQHLDMILKRLKNENIDQHPWGFFAHYINKNWLKKLTKVADWRKIALLINE